MRPFLIAIALFAVVGCGTEESSPNESLAGTWALTVDNVGVGFTFTVDGKFAFQRMRQTGSATADDEVIRGDYSATADRFTIMPREATCPGVYPYEAYSYRVTPDALTLVDNVSVINFPRVPDGGMAPGVAITLGCFADDGTFTPSPLSPVANQ